MISFEPLICMFMLNRVTVLGIYCFWNILFRTILDIILDIVVGTYCLCHGYILCWTFFGLFWILLWEHTIFAMGIYYFGYSFGLYAHSLPHFSLLLCRLTRS